MTRSFRAHYKDRVHASYTGYVKEHYEIQGYMSDKFMSNNQNMVSQFQNYLAKAIQEEILFPKMVVIVPDDDMVHYLNHQGQGITKPLCHMVDHLMGEFTKLVEIQKDFLLKKCKKLGYPQFIWIEAPLHDNFVNNHDRIKFNRALNTAVKFHDDTYVLKFKKVWDEKNSNLYFSEFRRFTNEGLNAYWMAIDATLKFADTILLKKKQGGTTAKSRIDADKSSTTSTYNRDKYKWYKDDYRKSTKSTRHSSTDRDHERYRDRDRRNRSDRRRDRSEESGEYGRRLPAPPSKFPEKSNSKNHY